MAATDQTLRVRHSSDFTFTAVIYLNNSPVNLAGATLVFMAKWAVDDPDADCVFALNIGGGITVTNPSAGAISITIPASATENLPYNDLQLPYDLLLIELSGNRSYPLFGTLLISPNVTRS